MSGEFGEYQYGYFHNKIESAAEDALTSKSELVKLWGKILEDISVVAKTISYYEAGDSSFAEPVFQTAVCLPKIKDKLKEIDRLMADYNDIMRKAIREHVNDK